MRQRVENEWRASFRTVSRLYTTALNISKISDDYDVAFLNQGLNIMSVGSNRRQTFRYPGLGCSLLEYITAVTVLCFHLLYLIWASAGRKGNMLELRNDFGNMLKFIKKRIFLQIEGRSKFILKNCVGFPHLCQRQTGSIEKIVFLINNFSIKQSRDIGTPCFIDHFQFFSLKFCLNLFPNLNLTPMMKAQVFDGCEKDISQSYNDTTRNVQIRVRKDKLKQLMCLKRKPLNFSCTCNLFSFLFMIKVFLKRNTSQGIFNCKSTVSVRLSQTDKKNSEIYI